MVCCLFGSPLIQQRTSFISIKLNVVWFWHRVNTPERRQSTSSNSCWQQNLVCLVYWGARARFDKITYSHHAKLQCLQFNVLKPSSKFNLSLFFSSKLQLVWAEISAYEASIPHLSFIVSGLEIQGHDKKIWIQYVMGSRPTFEAGLNSALVTLTKRIQKSEKERIPNCNVYKRRKGADIRTSRLRCEREKRANN